MHTTRGGYTTGMHSLLWILIVLLVIAAVVWLIATLARHR